METLKKYYSLDECANDSAVMAELKKLEREGKLQFSLEKATDILKIEDLDLEENDIERLIEIFEKNDVFPYPDMEEDVEGDDDEGYNDFYDEEDQY